MLSVDVAGPRPRISARLPTPLPTVHLGLCLQHLCIQGWRGLNRLIWLREMSEASTWSSWVDLATVVLSVCAVATAYFSWKLSEKSLAAQEKHNRLSLRPIPYIALADYEHLLRVKCVNDGAGPYIIKSVQVARGNDVRSDVISWMESPPDGIFWSSFTSNFLNRGVLPNNEVILLELEGDPKQPDFVKFRDDCRLGLSKLRIILEYTDIYEDTFPKHFRALDWFARKKST